MKQQSKIVELRKRIELINCQIERFNKDTSNLNEFEYKQLCVARVNLLKEFYSLFESDNITPIF
jgi:hypothetical protein